MLTMATTIALSACGGGGSNGGQPTVNPPPPPPPPPPPAPVNVNINNPTLTVADNFAVAPGDTLTLGCLR